MSKGIKETVREADKKVFYEMEKHSQLVIDFVEELEELEGEDFENPETRGALVYDIDNILEIIDPKRIEDIKVLSEIKLALRRGV